MTRQSASGMIRQPTVGDLGIEALRASEQALDPVDAALAIVGAVPDLPAESRVSLRIARVLADIGYLLREIAGRQDGLRALDPKRDEYGLRAWRRLSDLLRSMEARP